MEEFNKKFAEAMAKIGIAVVDEDGKTMTEEETTSYLNDHTIFEIEGDWYTYHSIFLFGKMQNPYKSSYKGNCDTVDKLTFYMLNDCNVSGLCIAEKEGKYGLFPLKQRTGSQSGIWCCRGNPFIYDDVSVFADWERWDDYGYVAAKKDGKWGAIKIIQFPEPSVDPVVDFIYSSSLDAVRATGEEYIPDGHPFSREI